MDGNDLWETLFSILKGNVPDELTVEVLDELAASIAALRAPAIPSERDVALVRAMEEALAPLREVANRYSDTMGLTREGAIRRLHVLADSILDLDPATIAAAWEKANAG